MPYGQQQTSNFFSQCFFTQNFPSGFDESYFNYRDEIKLLASLNLKFAIESILHQTDSQTFTNYYSAKSFDLDRAKPLYLTKEYNPYHLRSLNEMVDKLGFSRNIIPDLYHLNVPIDTHPYFYPIFEWYVKTSKHIKRILEEQTWRDHYTKETWRK